MNLPKNLASLLVAGFAFSATISLPAAQKDARVTQIVHEVKLLQSTADPRAAKVNDRVAEDTAVRTGDKSRSELTFADLTITRLGANTIYSYNRGGRSVDLDGGSILLRVPKESGGASIKASAVSVAVTGTTLILEASRGGRSKLLVLEGSAQLSLVKHPAQRRSVQGGQMLDVPAGATTLPLPVSIDLRRALREHPLLVNFPPLPSQDLILAAADGQAAPNEPVYQGQPVAGQPVGIFPGVILPPLLLSGGHGNIGRPPSPNTPGNSDNAGHGKGDTRNPPGSIKRPPSRGKKPPPTNAPSIR
ncbi:MAG: FecR domain-containing protein [Chthoniobacterales bacterium]